MIRFQRTKKGSSSAIAMSGAALSLREGSIRVSVLVLLAALITGGFPQRAEARLAEDALAGPQEQPKARTERLPTRLKGIDVEEKLEQPVPSGLSFRDDSGKTVVYDELVRGDIPTILTLNYSDCPMLCSLQLNALVGSMRQVDLTLGKDYQVVTVSLDPEESVERARDTKNRYFTMYGRPDAPKEGWRILTGKDETVHAVAEALGFVYGYNEARDEYIHPAAFVIATPEGLISRYIYGLEYHPKTLRLSLIEASEGKIGSSVDRLILYCFQYDATEGHYAPVAMNIMRVSAGSGAVALGALLTGLWRNDNRRKRKAASSK
jgi:protein SCO1/2